MFTTCTRMLRLTIIEWYNAMCKVLQACMSPRPSRSEKEVRERLVGVYLRANNTCSRFSWGKPDKKSLQSAWMTQPQTTQQTRVDEMEGRRGSERAFNLRRAYLRCDEREVRRCGNVRVWLPPHARCVAYESIASIGWPILKRKSPTY